MSFLPHADAKGLAWYGSMTASAATHAGVIAFFMLSGAVAFLPDPVESERPEPEFAVSLEILDAEIVGEADVIDESMLIPPDAIPLEPDTQTEAELPDSLTALDPDQETLAPDDFRRHAPRFGEDALKANTARLATLTATADRREATPAQVALAWVLAKGAFAIPGTKRLPYLEQNVAAASRHLSAEEIDQLDRAYAPGTFAGERYSAEGMKGVNA